MFYGDALKEIAASIDAVGIPATIEQANLQVPGALVVPGTLSFDHLDRETYSARVEVYLCTSDRGAVETLNDLQQMLFKVKDILGFQEVEPVKLQSPNHSADGLPALLIALDATITKD